MEVPTITNYDLPTSASVANIIVPLSIEIATARTELFAIVEPSGITWEEFWRYWEKININGPRGCWLWIPKPDELGYGRLGRLLGETRAHRIAYRLFKGAIPEGLVVMHACDVRICCNPDHLSVGTQAENVADMMDKGRHVTVPRYGEDNAMSALTRDLVEEIRALALIPGNSMSKLANQFNVSPMTINRAVRRETWK